MPKRGSFVAGIADEARQRMGCAASQDEFRRWQAVWLAAEEDRSNDEIARITGLAVTTVRWLHARCRKDGLSSLGDKPVGGRCLWGVVRRLRPSNTQSAGRNSLLSSFLRVESRPRKRTS